MLKISNFKLAHSILRTACRSKSVHFIDLGVEFLSPTDAGDEGYRNGKILVAPRGSLSGSTSAIVFKYLNSFEDIHQVQLFSNKEQRVKVYAQIHSLLALVFLDKKIIRNALPDKPVAQRIYQYRLACILMKGLICPIYGKKFDNFKIITYESAYLDGSQILKSEDFLGNEKYQEYEFPFVFLNFDVLYEPAKMAHLFISALECHDLNPRDVVQDILESELRDKLVGLVNLEYTDDIDADNFLAFLCTFLDIEDKTNELLTKNAQANSNSGPTQMGGMAQQTTWWYLGLIEKMLDPVRGQDWTTHRALEEMRSEVWDKIEHEKAKQGVDAISYERMLRIRDGEVGPEDVAVLEKVLSNDRIW